MSGSPPQQRLEGLTVTDVAFQGQLPRLVYSKVVERIRHVVHVHGSAIEKRKKKREKEKRGKKSLSAFVMLYTYMDLR